MLPTGCARPISSKAVHRAIHGGVGVPSHVEILLRASRFERADGSKPNRNHEQNQTCAHCSGEQSVMFLRPVQMSWKDVVFSREKCVLEVSCVNFKLRGTGKGKLPSMCCPKRFANRASTPATETTPSLFRSEGQ